MAANALLLFQIRRGYRARWNRLLFTVESENGQWNLRVQESGKEPALYAGQRSNLSAAKTAAAEFALFQPPGTTNAESPEKLAKQLEWKEYW
jgi:hypothetical protein